MTNSVPPVSRWEQSCNQANTAEASGSCTPLGNCISRILGKAKKLNGEFFGIKERASEEFVEHFKARFKLPKQGPCESMPELNRVLENAFQALRSDLQEAKTNRAVREALQEANQALVKAEEIEFKMAMDAMEVTDLPEQDPPPKKKVAFANFSKESTILF